MTTRAVRAVLLALVLALPAALASGSAVVLDASGALLVGLAGVGVGDVDDDDPVPDSGLDPVSLARHPFAIARCGALLVVFEFESATTALLGREEAVMQVEIDDPSGATLHAALATGGYAEFAIDGPLAPGDYVASVFHLIGAGAEYRVTAVVFDASCA